MGKSGEQEGGAEREGRVMVERGQRKERLVGGGGERGNVWGIW